MSRSIRKKPISFFQQSYFNLFLFLTQRGNRKWVGHNIKRFFFGIPYNNSNKVKMNYGFQLFEVEMEMESPVELFGSKVRLPLQDSIQCGQGAKTQNPTLVPSGEWRTNVLLDDQPFQKGQRTLSLRHLTSFEEKSMEDHGKILKNALENYLRFAQKRFCPEEELTKASKRLYGSWDETELALELISNLEQNEKTSLIKFSKRNVEAQLVLRQVLNNVPENCLADCLRITDYIFKQFELANGESMDEDQIETYVCLNFSILAEKVKEGLLNSQMVPTDQEGEHQFQDMIGTWMQTIFLALIGVFENPEDRKTPIQDLEGFETFYTSRKLIKID